MAYNGVAHHTYANRSPDNHGAHVRQESSGDVDKYIDMYRLSLDGSTPPLSSTSGSPISRAESPGLRQLSSQAEQHAADEVDGEDGFLSSRNVAQELRNLANLRRLSLDVANNHHVDPDVPLQSFDLAPARRTQADSSDEPLIGDDLYWVPAGIHPEIAPQEWQTFVQRRDAQFDFLDSAPGTGPGPFRAASLKRGLSRSRSLLSRQVTEQQADGYRDAAPDLARRRSKARSPVAVQGYARLGDELARQASPRNDSTEDAQPTQQGDEDEPILIPPPGQILRRAARTGKGRGSYRKPGRGPTRSEAGVESPVSPGVGAESLPPATESLSSIRQASLPAEEQSVDEELPVLRKKSSHRQTQIVGPPSPHDEETLQLGASAASLYLAQRDAPRAQNDAIAVPQVPVVQPETDRKRPNTADDFHVAKPLVSQPSPRYASVMEGEQLKVREGESRPSSEPSAPPKTTRPAAAASDLPATVIPGVPATPPTTLSTSSVDEKSETTTAKVETQRPPPLKRELSAASLTRAVMSGAAVPSSASASPASTAALGPSARAVATSPEKRAGGPVADESASKKSGWGKLFSGEDKTARGKVGRPGTGVVQAGVMSATAAATGGKVKRTGAATEESASGTNLFSSLFGGGKKKEKEADAAANAMQPGRIVTVPSRPAGSGAMHATSTSGTGSGTVPSRPPLHEPHFYTRFPMQLERAIYRMAHLKLGNSRRPLLHQVGLSNFMYGYLELAGAGARQLGELKFARDEPISLPGTPPRPSGELAQGWLRQANPIVRDAGGGQQPQQRQGQLGGMSNNAATGRTGKRQSPPHLQAQAASFMNGQAQSSATPVTKAAGPVKAAAEGSAGVAKVSRPGPPRRESSMTSYRPSEA